MFFFFFSKEKIEHNSDGSRISQGAATPDRVRQPIILQNVCQKIHENERNWTEKGRVLLALPVHRFLGSATATRHPQSIFFIFMLSLAKLCQIIG